MNVAAISDYLAPEIEIPEHASDSAGIVLTIEEAARRLKIGRTTMYSLVMSGEVESVSIGRLRRIPTECLTEYVLRLRSNTQKTKPRAA